MPSPASQSPLWAFTQRAIHEMAADGVGLVNASGRIEYASPAFVRIVGEDPTGRQAVDLVATEARDEIVARLADHSVTSTVHDIPLRRPPGAPATWARVVLASLRDAAGAHVGTMVVLMDITDRRRSEQALRTIAEVSRAFAGELDIDAIVRSVAESMNAGALVAELEGTEAVVLRAVATIDPRTEAPLRMLLGRSLRLLPGTTGYEVIWQSRSLRIGPEDLSRLTPPFDRLAQKLGVGSAVICPLVLHGRVTGVLSVIRSRLRELLTAEDLPLVREIADRAALAIDRAHLFEEQHIHNERLRLLADIGTAMAQSLDVETGLAATANRVVSSFSDVCNVMLFAGGVPMRYVGAASSAELEEKARRAADRFIKATITEDLRRLFTEGKARFIPSVDEAALRMLAVDDAHFALLQACGFRSLILVPLVARGHALGGITFGRVQDPPFGEDDLAFAQELGHRAGFGVDNARLYRRANEAIAVRDEFLSIASHELKTPLTPLKMQLDTLRRGKFSPERTAEKLDVASRQVTRLTTLVSELLDVSRIRVGKLKLEPERVDLSALVDEVVGRMAGEAKRAGSSLSARVDRPCVGTWDRSRLDQVVTNLLANAIKYGDGKPIAITLERVGDRVRFSVRDHGMGISPEHQRRIFERFERAASTRNYGGFGLGLWITRQIVEACGGTITVESSVGQGSTFMVELPCSSEQEMPRATPPLAT